MGEQHGRTLRILAVEDNPADVQLLRWALDAAGLDYEMTVIVDGGDALAYVRREGTDEGPDLVILDLNLPKNDGVEVLEAMRGNEALKQVPVVVLSSSSSPRERVILDRFRVGKYLVKPPDLDEYLRIGRVIKEFVDGTKSFGAYAG